MRVVSILLLTEVLCIPCVYYVEGLSVQFLICISASLSSSADLHNWKCL